MNASKMRSAVTWNESGGGPRYKVSMALSGFSSGTEYRSAAVPELISIALIRYALCCEVQRSQANRIETRIYIVHTYRHENVAENVYFVAVLLPKGLIGEVLPDQQSVARGDRSGHAFK